MRRASTCSVCVNPEIASLVYRWFRAGVSPHSIHLRLQRELGECAPSRAAVFRHANGDRTYRACLSESDRAEHVFARRRAGNHELRGAAAESAALGRTVPRGSARFIEQVAQFLIERQVIPKDLFDQVGLDGSPARRLADPAYEFPEERSIRQGWPAGWGRR